MPFGDGVTGRHGGDDTATARGTGEPRAAAPWGGYNRPMADQFSGRIEIGEAKSGEERRRAPRLERTFDLNYRIVALPDEKTLLETLDKLLTGKSQDLSEVGISMWTNKLLMPGTTLEMKFPAATAGDQAVAVKARVVWCQPHTEGGFVRARAGLEFVDVDPDTRARLVVLIREGAAPTAA